VKSEKRRVQIDKIKDKSKKIKVKKEKRGEILINQGFSSFCVSPLSFNLYPLPFV